MSDNFNKNRLAKNTILLYVRMLFTMWLNLYTTRLTLANLGVEDMGIYGVVGSIVSMFAVFSSGMINAVQRFLTYEIGRDNGDPIDCIYNHRTTKTNQKYPSVNL